MNVSAVSRCFRSTTKGTGSIGSGAALTAAAAPDAPRRPASPVSPGRLGGVEIEELQASGVEALPDDVGEALQELVAEVVVLLALLAEGTAPSRVNARVEVLGQSA